MFHITTDISTEMLQWCYGLKLNILCAFPLSYFHFHFDPVPQDDRTELLERLAQQEQENSKLKAELEKYRECDPQVLEEVKQQTMVAREAANRWTGV